MSDSPARRPASGSCCGGPRGGASVYPHRHQRLPHPETGGGNSFTLDDPTRRFVKKGVVAGTRREARTATRCANLEPKPLARSGPEPATCEDVYVLAVDAVPGSAGDAPPPAGGEGSVFRPKSAPQSSAPPTFGGRRFSDRIRSKRSVRRRDHLRSQADDRRSYSKHNSPFFAPAFTG